MPKLTDRFLSGLKVEPGRKDRLVFDATCPGLGVRVTAKGTRAFLVQWTDPATRRKVREPLGVWGSLTIEQAREAARTRLGSVAKGIDPKAERTRRKAEADSERAATAFTLDALILDWASLHLAQRRPRYAAEAVRALRSGLASLMKRPAALITRGDAVNALDLLVKAGKAPTAGRTLAYARACFRWAEKRGKLNGNPFRDLPISTRAVERDRVLGDAELAEIWKAATALPNPFGAFFQLAILTLQRREEVAGMRWSEIAPDLSVWTIPGERMKNGKPHDVHLAEPARKVLAALPRVDGCDFVLSTTGKRPISGFSKAKIALDSAIAVARKEAGAKPTALAPWRLHDFRRTGVSTLARLGIDSIVADKLLAHKAAKLRGVAAVYQRHDFGPERARALDAWAAHVVAVAAGERGAGSNVISLKRSG